MSYRKIEIDGTVYEYVTGRSHTKVKGVGVFLNETIGEQYDILCHCGCGESLNDLQGDTRFTKTGVTPASIQKAIKHQLRSTANV